MSEVSKPETAEPEIRTLSSPAKPKRRQVVKPAEVLIVIVFIVVVAVLISTLVSKITLKRDAAHAQIVSDKVVADIQRRNGSAVRALGTPTFKKTYSAASLTQEFQNITIATLKPPKLDSNAVVDGPPGRTVFFIYEYTALKVPYYIRTSILNKSGTWELTSISGSADESTLAVN